ncbi:hypothetical protein DOY81_006248 [Sarcophaga bullata]|nr:hypothetical protein DOY81_006248 [Sarcophaga bullata]
MISYRFLCVLVLILNNCLLEATLLFPAASVLQITASIAAPIEIPGRKLYWDWGFQMNYDLPFNVKQFYNAPIWPDKFDDRKRRSIEALEQNSTIVWHSDHLKYHKEAGHGDNKHSNDFTAGEFYGFHDTCLMRSVCELARHPFADDQQNILTEILTFILTPSMHEAFAASESLYRDVYEEAERRGFLGYNCADLYYECKQDLLTSITNVITHTYHST